MDAISSRYRKPKGRSNKRRRASKANANKRWKQEADKVTSEANTTSESSCLQSAVETPRVTIMSNSMWPSLLSNVNCSECQEKKLDVKVHRTYGYCSKLSLICNSCNYEYDSTYSSNRLPDSRRFEINQKLVEGILSVGKGHAALETFSMILGIPTMDRKTFANCLDSLAENIIDSKRVILAESHEAVRQRHLLDTNLPKDSVLDISVTYDGTWQKRGYTSMFGIGIVIDILTGLVVDYEVLSKYCHECVIALRDLGHDSAEYHIWSASHKSSCQENFSGSSSSMESHAALVLWTRSIESANMRYATMLSDGDSKSFQHLNNNKVYGADILIEKEECINHVAKRLGTALRNKVKEWKAKGFTLGGRKKGNLKEETIVKLQNFYRKALKDNAPSVTKMKTAVLATLYHCMSTDKKPQHSKCPTDEKSWCFYNRDLALNRTPKTHSTMKTVLNESVVVKIIPVYQRLLTDELLSRCRAAKTQNANESLHSCIWKKCPKEVFVSKKRLELAVLSAIREWNFGCVKSLEMCSEISEVQNCSSISISIAKKKDQRRSSQKVMRSTVAYKNKRNVKKYQKTKTNAKLVKKEGDTYGAGMF